MTRLLSLLAFVLLITVNTACADEESTTTESAAQGAVAENSDDFTRLVPAQPTSTAPGQVEVLEFFWYGCRHCYESENHIKAWHAAAPEGVLFRRVPATLNQGWTIMARAYYTAAQLGVLDAMHPAFFAAFHEEARELKTEDQLAAFFKEKANVEEAAFRDAFNSMRVASRVQRADLLARRYRVSGVPTMSVNGKYVTDPMQANGYSGMVDTVARLARQELSSQSEGQSDQQPEQQPE